MFICVHPWFPSNAAADSLDPLTDEEQPVSTEATPLDEEPSSIQEPYVLDEQSGYYWTFAFVATAAEILGGVAIGAGAAQVADSYARVDLAGRTATVEDGDGIRSTSDNLETTGWIMSSVGMLGFGLGFALDFVLGDEFGDDDWWVRVGITTPLAAGAAAMISSGIVQVYRSADYRTMALQMAAARDRDSLQADADDFAVLGWSLIGVGGAMALAVTAYWLWDWVEADTEEDDGGSSDVSVAVIPSIGPQMQGLGLLLNW